MTAAHAVRVESSSIQGEHASARDAYQRVEQQNPDLLPEVIDRIQACYDRLGDMAGWEDYLGGLVERHPYLVFAQKNLLERPAQPPAGQQARYRCEECGFTSRKLFWRCPGCQCWSSVKPIKMGMRNE